MDRFLQSLGFRLFDLDIWCYCRIDLPFPYVNDYRGGDGLPVAGPTVAGKPRLGDALYFRDVVAELRAGMSGGRGRGKALGIEMTDRAAPGSSALVDQRSV